jgi:flagellar secretion chaperone FliS
VNPKLSYREAAVQGASPLRLVVLLYEQAIEDLRRALAAQHKGEVEVRTREINHAILVIGHLQASLDLTQGGEVATNLRNFYAMVRAGLVEAQCRQSESLLEREITHLLTVHDAWCRAEREVAEQAPAPPAREDSATEWRA